MMGLGSLIGAGILGDGPQRQPPKPVVYEKHFALALAALQAAEDQVVAMKTLFADFPDCDQMFGQMADELGRRLHAAGDAMDRFRAVTGCEGEG